MASVLIGDGTVDVAVSFDDDEIVQYIVSLQWAAGSSNYDLGTPPNISLASVTALPFLLRDTGENDIAVYINRLQTYAYDYAWSTAEDVVSSLNFTSSQTLDAFTQSATFIAVDNLSSSQTIGDFRQSITIQNQVDQPIIGGGSYNFGPFRNKQKRYDDEIKPREPTPIEIVKIGKAPNEVITGLVIQKATVKKSRPKQLDKIFKSSFDAAKLKSDRLRQIQLADDEWLMMN